MIKAIADDTDEYEKLYLSDGERWTEVVEDALENANWHNAREAFSPLLHILPEVYDALEQFGLHGLARKLDDSTNRWDYYF